MHFDLAHAVVTAILLFAILTLYRQFYPKAEGKRFDWGLFAVTVVVMFVLNLVWPLP